jgi:hypothetical protein
MSAAEIRAQVNDVVFPPGLTGDEGNGWGSIPSVHTEGKGGGKKKTSRLPLPKEKASYGPPPPVVEIPKATGETKSPPKTTESPKDPPAGQVQCRGLHGNRAGKGCGKYFDPKTEGDGSFCRECRNKEQREKRQALRAKAVIISQSIKEVKMRGEINDTESIPDEDAGNDDEGDIFGIMLGMIEIKDEPLWLDMGRAIFNQYDGDGAGLTLWKEKTAGTGISVSLCDGKWSEFRSMVSKCPPRTVKDLMWIARDQNQVEWKAWHTGWFNHALNNAIRFTKNPNHADVSEALYRFDPMKFVYDGTKFWHFSQRWREQSKKNEMLRANIRMIRKGLKANIDTWTKEHQAILEGDSPNQPGRYPLEQALLKADTLYQELGKEGFINSVISNVADLYINVDFDKWKNGYINITGMLKGVIVANEKGLWMWRESRPEDYVVKSTWVEWIADMNDDSENVKTLRRWLDQMFPDKAQEKLFFSVLSLGFIGQNLIKKIVFLIGSGDNAKSTMIRLLELAFGEYCAIMSKEFFSASRRKGASGLDPELLQTVGARFMFISEPEGAMSTSLFKSIIDDSMFVRGCGKDGGKFEPTAIPIFSTNHAPRFVGLDIQTVRRILMALFKARWPANPAEVPESVEEQERKHVYRRDPSFKNKLPQLTSALIYMISKWFPIVMKEIEEKGQIDVPIENRSMVSDHVAGRDEYTRFCRIMICPAMTICDGKMVENKEAKVFPGEAYPVFRTWWQENCTGSVPSRDVFDERIVEEGRLGPPEIDGSWHGKMLRSTPPRQ